jgi:hypothetical protein
MEEAPVNWDYNSGIYSEGYGEAFAWTFQVEKKGVIKSL